MSFFINDSNYDHNYSWNLDILIVVVQLGQQLLPHDYFNQNHVLRITWNAKNNVKKSKDNSIVRIKRFQSNSFYLVRIMATNSNIKIKFRHLRHTQF